MSIRAIPRTAITGAVKLTRVPIDIAVSLLPGDGSGTRAAAEITVDRLDAAVRDAAGVALRDGELRDDAARRRAAADERARELRLRAEAADESAVADERFSIKVDDAEERRTAAQDRAAQQRRSAERRKQQRTRAAADTEHKRKATSGKQRAAVAEVIDEAADEARVEQLKAEAKALEERELALTAQAEAQRLQDEATKKKAARKQP